MTCQHCTFCEEEKIDVRRGLAFVEPLYCCTLHEHYVSPTYFCDNFTPETPDVTTQSERTTP